MPLSEARIHRGRPTPYPWEREALDLVYPGISDIDPYQAWELHELHDPSTGRLYEIDLAFLSRVGLFLVEIKSHPGVLTGDVVDWTFTEPGGRRRTIECPYASINHKAKVLASLLDRLDLDRLLAPHGLVFVPDLGEYIRPGQQVATSMTVQLPPRARTAVPGLPPRRDPDAQRAAAFQDQLDRGVASSGFRVVQVRADLATVAAQRLGEALNVAPVSLDHALAAAIRARAAADEVEWSNIEAADRAGPEGPDWTLLVGLVRDAADAMLDALLADSRGPLLLVWPGAFARYGLSAALSRLVERAERGDTGAVLLVVPSHADGLAPSINGRLPVPAPFPGQRLQMPEPWLANAHRAAEAG